MGSGNPSGLMPNGLGGYTSVWNWPAAPQPPSDYAPASGQTAGTLQPNNSSPTSGTMPGGGGSAIAPWRP